MSAWLVVVPVICALPDWMERRDPGVALPTPILELSVSKESKGMLDVDLLNENALIVDVDMVVVASSTMLIIVEVEREVGEEEPMVMRFESRYTLPPTERWAEGVVVAMPRKRLVVCTVRKFAESSVVEFV